MTESKAETWYVLGAGSLGQLWAALLHRGARPVCLVLRTQERIEEYRRAGGITLHEEYGWGRLTPPAVSTAGATMRRILVATKAHQTMDALEPYAALRDNSLSIAILQNGMGVAEEVQARFPSAWVYDLVTMTSAWREAPFDVHRAGRGKTFVGRHTAPGGGEDDASMIARSLTVPGLEVEFSADIRAAQWRKLVVNCVINPLSAILEIRNGQVPTDARALKVMNALCEELATVATAEGITLTAQDVLVKVESVCRITADNYNSMLQDVRAGRPTEIDYINGYVLARARALGIACPANQALYDDIKSRSPRR
jgi:2-dehydropantoate 2-reductase